MIKKIGLLYRTLRHLKAVQFYYRIYFILFKDPVIRFYKSRPHQKDRKGSELKLAVFPSSKDFTDGKTFDFLNQKKTFHASIDWNDNSFGKLWTYNLNYFNFINYEKTDRDVADSLIENFCIQLPGITTGLEPYPISLRSINWIKYLSVNRINNPKWNNVLFAQMMILKRLTEYHLLGNHLIENGFALLYGAYYFRDEDFYRSSVKILHTQLKEQILNDGGHFERSPMYHCILLERILDCLNLVANNSWKDDLTRELLREKASAMTGWLHQVIFSTGDVPQVNDTVAGANTDVKRLLEYAASSGVKPTRLPLNESGYRMVTGKTFQLFVDVGNIGPDYIPGHAHSDTFSFLLYLRDRPIIVETGTSTYTPGERRMVERSTKAHNTVMIDGKEQTEVWGTFRVGRRARIVKLNASNETIEAAHDGYDPLMHQRSWKWFNDRVQIFDTISPGSGRTATAFIHFHPDFHFEVKGQSVISDVASIRFEGTSKISVFEYQMANGFNRTLKAKGVAVEFRDELMTNIAFT